MKQKHFFMLLLFFIGIKANGQITISSNHPNTATIDTYAEASSGKTAVGVIALQYNISTSNLAAGWTVRVRANGPFKNGIYTIPSPHFSLKFNTATNGPTNVSGNAAPLTSADAVLLQGTAALTTPPTYYMAQSFNLIIQGGNHLFVPATGVYSTSLTVGIYDKNGALIAVNANIPLSFTMNFSNRCLGISIAAQSDNAYNFNTYAQLATGATFIDALNVRYTTNNANCKNWTLKIRANGNFTNGSSSISPDHVALRFNRVAQGLPTAAAIGVTNNAVPLLQTDATLINNSNGAFDGYTHQVFDMIIQGGNYLAAAKPGVYSCPVTLTLYNQDGELVSSSNTSLAFQFTFNTLDGGPNITMTLSNPNVNFQYNLPTDYITGKSETKVKGLKIIAYIPYQVIVKTLHPHLISGNNTIPSSVVQLLNSSEFNLSGITSTPIDLKHTDQVIIRNNMLDYNYQNTFYNLTYKIPGNTNAITSAPAGTYSNTVIFVTLPL